MQECEERFERKFEINTIYIYRNCINAHFSV